MANPKRGEHSISVKDDGGERQIYRLVFTNNSLASIEDVIGSIAEYGERIDRGFAGFKELRVLLWGSLQKHHGREFRVLEDAGDLMDRAQEQKVYDKVITSAMNAYSDAVQPFMELGAQESENGDSAKKGRGKSRANLKAASTSGDDSSATGSDEG